MSTPRTMFEKIWESHVVVRGEGDQVLLYIDRNLVHEGSFHAFGALAKEGRKVRRPHQTTAVADHCVPTLNRERGLAGVADGEARDMIELLEKNTAANGVEHF